MAFPDALGQFELYVLAALEHLGEDAYGVTIRVEIEERSRRPISHGEVCTTLQRLEEKGYIAFRHWNPTPAQGGRARKYARLTPAGRQALHECVRALDRMLDGLRPVFRSAGPAGEPPATPGESSAHRDVETGRPGGLRR